MLTQRRKKSATLRFTKIQFHLPFVNSKLVQLLKTLNRKELRAFSAFFHSPYFNKHASITQFGDLMVSLAKKGFTEAALQPQVLYQQLQPGQDFQEKDFNYLASNLLKLGERFLAQLQFEQEAATLDLYTLAACQQRKLSKSFAHHSRRLDSQLASHQHNSPARFYQRYRYQQIALDQFNQEGNRTSPPFLQPAADALDTFYLTQKLRLSCSMLNHQLALSETYTYRFISPEILAEVPALPYSELTLLYTKAFQLLQTTNRVDLFEDFVAALQNERTKLEPEITSELFYQALNYCVRQIRAGHRSFANRLLNLYRTGLEAGYLLENGSLSPWNYKNIVKLGLGLGQLDWVEEFVTDYTPQLPLEAQADARHFNLADIAYHRRNYDSAIIHLHQTEFTDIHYALGAKTMLIKIYYETGEAEALLSLLFSFRLFLLRNKSIGQATKDAYLNFVRFTQKLFKAKSSTALTKLKTQIDQCGALSDRSWLLGTIKELLKN